MAVMPRVLIVDPTGFTTQLVRAAADLLNRPIILIDMPGPREALQEVKNSSCQLLITAVELNDDIKGIQLAIQTRRESVGTQAIILADTTDPNLDDETLAESPFVYLRKPVNVPQLLRVLEAGLCGEDIFTALAPPAGVTASMLRDMGPMPYLDMEVARTVIDGLLTDVGAMAIILSSRTGEILLERGAVGYIDREKLVKALIPMITTTLEMSDLVGGRTSSIQFFDGSDYDIFVLTAGLHHFLSVVMDGQAGNRQFGAVNRFGRRAAEDLIALLGAAAYSIKLPPLPAIAEPPTPSQPKSRTAAPTGRAKEDSDLIARPAIKVKEPEPLKLDPIENLDESIFDQLDKLDVTEANDLFDPEKLAELASESRRKDGPIGFDQAQELGIMPELD